ncbi:MAG TPA: hypothetical protein VH307_24980 [Streptosporangiaceae bacterium]|nr:hypothetical protein [Streptosporangiaceae bacterium]
MRARPGRGAPGGPGTPDSTGARSPQTGAGGLPHRIRPPRPESSDIAARDRVILSEHDLAVLRKAVAIARQDAKEDRQDAAVGRPGTGPGPPAEEPRETRPPEPRGSAPPPAMSQALPAANPAPLWGTVLANTVRMRARQRSWPGTARWRVIGALILAAIFFGGGAVTVTLTRGTTAGKVAADRGQAPGDAAIAAAATARTAAAAWMAQQVDPAAIVACDPQMCAVLQSYGIPSGRQLVLGAGIARPLGSDVIASTAAVREEFGSRLTSVYAPVALATFGSGSAQVAVRVVAADGSAAYLRSLQADAAARRAAGALLPRNPHVRVSPAGRRELAAGRVDARLLSVIGALATPYHLDITGFGAPAAGASPGVPLRSADISPAPAGPGGDAATLDSVKRFLLAQQAPFRPADVTTVRLASGQTVLRIEFTAPSPLGLLGAPN